MFATILNVVVLNGLFLMFGQSSLPVSTVVAAVSPAQFAVVVPCATPDSYPTQFLQLPGPLGIPLFPSFSNAYELLPLLVVASS